MDTKGSAVELCRFTSPMTVELTQDLGHNVRNAYEQAGFRDLHFYCETGAWVLYGERPKLNEDGTHHSPFFESLRSGDQA